MNAASEIRWYERLSNIFGCDLRSLALFRVALGLVLIWDLAFRWTSLKAMYTDAGYFTREMSYGYYQEWFGDGWSRVFWSLHWLSGELEFQAVLFFVAALFAILLTVGYRTRAATIISWILLVSLHVRNPLVISSGDFLLKMLLFWSIFLPLGRVWSIDAWRRGRSIATESKRYFSVATAALIIQLVLMYFFTGVAKLNEDWFDGNAMYYVLQLDIYIKPLGRSLLEYPLLLKLVSWATLFFEVIFIWTIFSPRASDRFRIANLVIFWAFHLAIAMSMQIGLFPVISMIAWLPLLPPIFWNRVLQGSSRYASIDATSDAKPIGRPGKLFWWGHGLAQAFCGVVLVGVICWNLGNLNHPFWSRFRPPQLTQLGYRLGVDQHFQMFGQPPRQSPWFVYQAELTDGTEFDVFRETPVDHNRPEWIRETFPTFHWRKMHRNLVAPKAERFRQGLADYAAKIWNEQHPPEKQVEWLRLMCYLEDIGPNYNQTDRHSVVWGTYRNDAGHNSRLLDQVLEQVSGDSDGMPF